MWLRSDRLALTGRADVVEFVPEPYPVEYKRGKRKPNDCDAVQLCAQALCLEEMLAVPVPRGAFFYGNPRRRLEVFFSSELRGRTESLSATMHKLFQARLTPAAQPGPHCRNCSLVDLCLPTSTNADTNAGAWLEEQRRSFSREAGTVDGPL